MKLICVFSISILVITAVQSQSRLTNNQFNDRSPRWSPDGKEIVFESDRNGNWDIYTLNPITRELTQITYSDAQDRRPHWHPTNKKILFESNRSGHSRLYEYSLDTRETLGINIPGMEGEFTFGSYAPDANRIAFNIDNNLAIYDLRNRTSKQITFDETRSLYPRWSPSGDHLCFFSRRDTKGVIDELYVINLSNNSVERVTEWATHNFTPSWSNDGRYLVCSTSLLDSRPEIFIVELSSQKLKRITHNSYSDTEPDWSLIDHRIVFASQIDGQYEIVSLVLSPHLLHFE